MLSEGLGKVSFWLFFIGFHLTFLIQHSAGLDGMPRRIYEYSADAGWALMNLMSTIGAFVLALSILLTIINVVRSLKKGVDRRARTRGRRNTLEWFTPSPPPENNFDVIPRVRSVEPMKDIRRQIERQTGVAAEVRGRQADGERVAWKPRAPRRPRPRSSSAASGRSSPTTSR